jgi:hypothetical protein
MRRLVLLAFACLLVVSCSVVYVKAPAGKNVTLLANEPTSIKIPMRNWYLLWGLIPLTDNNTATMIGQANIGQVRVKTYYTPLDFILNIPLSAITLHCNTVLLEGNPPPLEQK